MGELYKARDTRLHRTVALKLIGESALHDAEARWRFEREAKAIAALAHPHICVLYDVGEHEGRRFLVLEYLEGETLEQRLAHGALRQDEALRYAREIAEALDAAHRQGVTHRDLKPSNVMLTKTGAKLLDFGVATLREATALRHAEPPTEALDRTIEGTIIGTVPYMAPERLEGRPADARSDIFAFGAVWYEMLIGRRAFAGDNQASLIAAIINEDPAADDRITAESNRIIRRCLAKDPDERWQTARDLVQALIWLAERPSSAPAAARSPRFSRRWLVQALAMPVVAVGAGLYGWSHRTGADRSDTPVVILMDSTLPERIYDPDTRAQGGTNSDDITDALRGLSLESLKETTSAQWRREEQVLRQHPALVMMHLSSFARPEGSTDDPTLQPDAVERTRVFLGLVGLANLHTKFIVYTRGYGSEQSRNAWTTETEQRFPVLKGRLQMLHIPGDQRATFRDPTTQGLVREQVLTILQLPSSLRDAGSTTEEPATRRKIKRVFEEHEPGVATQVPERK
jgi:serine/threonine protein kinase